MYDSFGSSMQNVATERQVIKGDAGSIELDYDQKYEMISNIVSESGDFENDAGAIRKIINDLNGVVQMESSGGLEKDSNRVLWLSVGITPNKFDSLVDKLKEIGDLKSFTINKTDKTSEFHSYLAQREAMQKALDSYISLKSQGGEIKDLLVLEEKIIATEKEILQAGVTLGLYDENQSMCTVDFSLYELNYIEQPRRNIQFYMIAECAWEALGWTLMFYAAALLFIMITGFSAVGGAFVWSRIAKQQSKKTEVIQTNDDDSGNK
jgi:hypothetical protein